MRRRTLPLLAFVLLSACKSQERAPDIAGLIADLQGANPQKSGRANLELIRIGEPAVPALIDMATDQ